MYYKDYILILQTFFKYKPILNRFLFEGDPDVEDRKRRAQIRSFVRILTTIKLAS